VGGLGGVVALQLAAAGIGKLILAHAGNVKPSDLNRQVLMAHAALGAPRVECASERLREFNPRLVVEAVPQNITAGNVDDLVSRADIVFDCAPLFAERFAMNEACVRQGKPLIEAAMYSLEGQVTAIIPGRTPCLACIYPETPAQWKRQFPVFGAVASTAGSIAAMEGIRLIAGMKPALAGTMLYFDLEEMKFDRIPVQRRRDCAVCGHLPEFKPGSE
jgi:molybdopterin/thiamine biosynthesis adenylyltransferase